MKKPKKVKAKTASKSAVKAKTHTGAKGTRGRVLSKEKKAKLPAGHKTEASAKRAGYHWSVSKKDYVKSTKKSAAKKPKAPKVAKKPKAAKKAKAVVAAPAAAKAPKAKKAKKVKAKKAKKA